jgi:hypothetical protein
METLCVQCGPGVPVDEDGCCVLCGNGATGPWADTYARMFKAVERAVETNQRVISTFGAIIPAETKG